MGDEQIGLRNIYFEPIDAYDEKSKIYISELSNIKIVDSTRTFGNEVKDFINEEFLSNKSNKVSVTFTDKALIRMNQVKTKRLKKKYYKKTILYRLTREKRW